jgi:hypothetical protein
MGEWIGVREMERRRGVAHGAVRRAVLDGRIPEQAVRRAADGSIDAIEFEAATAAWNANTDHAQAARTIGGAATVAAPAPVPAAVVQTSVPNSYEADALRLHPGLEVGLISLPTILAREGLAAERVDRVLSSVYAAIRRELSSRQQPVRFIAQELAVLRDMVDDERAHPGTYTWPSE